MIRTQMYAIACGYEDCNDLDSLLIDPACGRLSQNDAGLMTQ